MPQTTKISTIDRATHKLIAERIAAHLTTLAEDLGLSITPAGGTFGIDGNTAAIVKLSVRTHNVEAATKAAKAEWDRYCELLGLRPEVFGMSFTNKGHTYTVCGLEPGRSKNTVKTTREDGKAFVWPAEAVRTLTKTEAPVRYARLTEVPAPGMATVDALADSLEREGIDTQTLDRDRLARELGDR